MKEIQLEDAEATLSAVVDAALGGEPSIISRRGKPQAVVLSVEEWRRLSRVPPFGRLLMSAPEATAELPERSRSRMRAADLRQLMN